MIVRLNKLDEFEPVSLPKDISVERADAFEKHEVMHFTSKHFSNKWVSEVDISFSRQPISCFIAKKRNDIIGFCVYEVSAKGVIGPIGVKKAFRSFGVGRSLLLHGLFAMRALGYAYGIIGWVGPKDFFSKTVGAVAIPQSA
jgi:hypothetical protein